MANKAYALAGEVAGAIVAVAGIAMGCASGFDSTAWWTIGTGVALVVVGLLFQFDVIEPDKKSE